MFQVVPEPEFEAWYESLSEPLAEEVATAIDLVASASGVLAPERLSRLLLWFDGTGTGSGADLGVPGLTGLAKVPELPAARARAYLTWYEEVLLCLESSLFRERLERLEPALAAQALAQVERLRRKLHAARMSGNWSPWANTAGAPAASTTDPSGVRAVFSDLLRLVGLEPQLVLGSGNGLRELCIENVRPQLRVLFGLDFPGRRLIAILGEALDRRYYGDSVRRAERRWQAYCDDLAEGRASVAR
jgi:hypothetical protein